MDGNISLKLASLAILIGCLGFLHEVKPSANFPSYNLRVPDRAWKNWARRFNKRYQNENEERERFETWKKNEKFIKDFNEKQDKKIGKNKMKLKMNKFGDLTNQEYR